jgi:transcriptional regulator with XRE-family HTH domain
MPDTFGDFVKEKRLQQGLGLRSFCAEIGMDPANYSKIERGKLAPPKDIAALEKYRRALCIDGESADHREMLRLASLGRGELPQSVLSDKELAAKLPAFFRTLDGDPVDEALLDELIATIRREL